jgi:hypothetical protein
MTITQTLALFVGDASGSSSGVDSHNLKLSNFDLLCFCMHYGDFSSCHRVGKIIISRSHSLLLLFDQWTFFCCLSSQLCDWVLEACLFHDLIGILGISVDDKGVACCLRLKNNTQL